MSLPNILTLIRIILVPIFFTVLVSPALPHSVLRFSAVFIFGAAALTDALDGFFARALKQQTELGAFLDPLADKLLVVFGLLGILLTPQAVFKPPLWIQVTILFREIILLLGFVMLFFLSKEIRIQPNYLGKCTTFSQMLLILFCLLSLPNAIGVAYFTAILTIISGCVYSARELIKFS